jgi:alkylation response protein AidB-like acyl-CoA dehydrogenase
VRLAWDDATTAFRRELVEFVAAHLPPPEARSEPVRSSAHLPEWARRWQRTLFDHGWLVPGWPPELGGRNATPVQQLVYFEELARLDVPRSCNPQGLSIVTPSIVEWGTPEQVERFALPTLRAEISWCLGMSEPEAGSDLAGLSTRAELVGDHFVVNGQKIWTSGAHDADFCFCFVRTDPDAPKHRGISVLVIDMRSPGISVRPIAELTDPNAADFNEVFFSDVVVPRDHLVGPLNGGWSIAGTSLAHERGMLWVSEATGLARLVERAAEVAASVGPDGRRLGDDPWVRDRIADAWVRTAAIFCLGYRGFARLARGGVAPEHSLLKLLGSELRRDFARQMAEARGALGVELAVADAPGFGRGGDEPWVVHHLRAFAGTIAGGTSEIQRNIVAERTLGLPRS